MTREEQIRILDAFFQANLPMTPGRDDDEDALQETCLLIQDCPTMNGLTQAVASKMFNFRPVDVAMSMFRNGFYWGREFEKREQMRREFGGDHA